MRSYSAREKGRPRRSQVTCDLVGVAEFEPAACSSRSQVGRRLNFESLPLTCSAPSAGVRRGPAAASGIVTQIVTRRGQAGGDLHLPGSDQMSSRIRPSAPRHDPIRPMARPFRRSSFGTCPSSAAARARTLAGTQLLRLAASRLA
jgi:hypothetical protein